MFQKGVCANPHGRPKEKDTIHQILRKMGRVIPPGANRKRIEAMWEKMYQMAIDGNVNAAKLIADRSEGRPKTMVDITSKGQHINKKSIFSFSIIDKEDVDPKEDDIIDNTEETDDTDVEEKEDGTNIEGPGGIPAVEETDSDIQGRDKIGEDAGFMSQGDRTSSTT